MSKSNTENRPSRTTIVHDLLVFQVKLWLEGLKDVALVPLSIGAAVLDILFRNSTGQGALYMLMRAGDRFEQWVNLYGALEKRQVDKTPSSTSFSEETRASLQLDSQISNGEKTPLRQEANVSDV